MKNLIYYKKLDAFITLLALNLKKHDGKKIIVAFNQNMKFERIIVDYDSSLAGLILYESNVISVYKYLIILSHPNVDDFVLLLIIDRLLNNKTIEEQADILNIDTRSYYKYERGLKKIKEKEKKLFSKKLHIYNSKEALFTGEFRKRGDC